MIQPPLLIDVAYWWHKGRRVKAKGDDVAAWAKAIKSPVARRLFLAGAKQGSLRPTTQQLNDAMEGE